MAENYKKTMMMLLKRFLCSASDALTKRQRELMARSLPKKKTLSGVHNVVLVASGKGEISLLQFHSWPKNLKKVRPKNLVKSNKSISRKNF